MSSSGPLTDPITPTRNLRAPRPDQTVGEAVPLAIPIHSPVSGLEIPGYEILGELGRGGMGVVYKARHRALDRIVALKLLIAGARADPVEIARFNFEAQSLARIRHPNIVEVYEAGWLRNQPYMALEYVEGGTLSDRLGTHPLPPRQAAEIVHTLARALEVVHRQGLIHRDLKPSNVLVQRGEPGKPMCFKIGDFGLARPIEQSQQLTQTGFVVGTPHYMSPEQLTAQSDQVCPATDVYALGVIFFELLTAQRPFGGPSMVVLEEIRTREAQRPSRLNRKVPKDLDVICLKCLEKEPRRRYASAAELADDIERHLQGRAILARPVGPIERAWKWARHRPAVAALLGLLIVVSLLGFFGILWQWSRAEERAAVAESERLDAEASRELAEAEFRKGEAARKRERDAAGRERDARLRAETALYNGHMLLALHEYEAGNLVQTRSLLERYRDIPEDDKGWEYRWLRRVSSTPVADLHTFRSWPWKLAFDPQGERLAVAGGGGPGENGIPGNIHLFDPKRPAKPLVEIRTSMATRTWLAFSPDGRLIAASGHDGITGLWDTSTGRQVAVAPCTPGTRVWFTPDGKSLLLNAPEPPTRFGEKPRNHAIRIIPLDGSPARILPGKELLDMTPDGRLVVVHDGKGELRFVETAGGKVVRTLTVPGGPRAFSPDEQFVAVHETDGKLAVWDVASGKRVRILATGIDGLVDVAFSPDGLYVVTATSDPIVRVYDIRRSQVVRQYRGHAGGLRRLAFRPDGLYVVSADHEGRISVWDLSLIQGGALLDLPSRTEHPDRIMGESYAALAFDATGDRLFAGMDNGRVSICDPVSLRLLGEYRIDSTAKPGLGLAEQAFSDDGRLLAVIARDRRSASLRTVGADSREPPREKLAFRGHSMPIHRLALSGDGRKLMTAAYEFENGPCETFLWDAVTGAMLHRFAMPPCFNLVLNRDGSRLATAGYDLKIRVWDVDRRVALPSPRPTRTPALAVTFSPKGDVLALGGLRDGSVRLCDTATGEDLPDRTLRPPSMLTCLAYNPSGTRLAAVGWDGIVHLWDAATGQDLLMLRDNHRPRIDNYQYTARVAFSPDDTRLAVIRWDGAITVYDTRPGEQGDTARRLEGWRAQAAQDRLRLAWELEQWKRLPALLPPREDEGLSIRTGRTASMLVHLACAHLLADDLPAYRKLCAELHERCKDERDEWTTIWLAEIGALGPNPFPGKDEALQRTKARAMVVKDHWSQFFLALALHRAGRDDEAMTALAEAERLGRDNELGLSFVRLLRAKLLLLKGDKNASAAERKLTNRPPDQIPWHTRLMYRLLERELERVGGG